MSPRIKLQVQSIIVAGIFCFFAAGSVGCNSSKKVASSGGSKVSVPDAETKPSALDTSVAIECDEPGGSGGDAHYLFYGDALKEFFTITSSGSVADRVSLSLTDSTSATYTYGCTELEPGVSESRGCSSFTLQRGSLQLSAIHSYSAAMAEARGSDTSTDRFQCHTMDKDKAAQILAQRNQAIQK